MLSFSTAVAYSFCDHAHCLVVFVLQSIDDIHADTFCHSPPITASGRSFIYCYYWGYLVPVCPNHQSAVRQRTSPTLSASLVLSSAWSLDGKVMYELESLQRVLWTCTANTKLAFSNISTFPNVLGAIDCTHVAIKAPKQDEDAYVIMYQYWNSLKFTDVFLPTWWNLYALLQNID